MHMHLVTFKVVGRTPCDAEACEEGNEGPHGVPGGIDPNPFATGPLLPPAPEEPGFKDTLRVNRGGTSRPSGRGWIYRPGYLRLRTTSTTANSSSTRTMT